MHNEQLKKLSDLVEQGKDGSEEVSNANQYEQLMAMVINNDPSQIAIGALNDMVSIIMNTDIKPEQASGIVASYTDDPVVRFSFTALLVSALINLKFKMPDVINFIRSIDPDKVPSEVVYEKVIVEMFNGTRKGA